MTTFIALLATTALAAPVDWNPDFGPGLGQPDDTCTQVDIGFAFELFGQSYSQVWVNSNGNLSFDRCHAGWDWLYFDVRNPSSSASTALVAPLFGDFDPNVAGDVHVSRETDRFTVTWNMVPEYESDWFTSPDEPLNLFQAQLFANGDILFLYNGLGTDGYSWWEGNPFVVGLSTDSSTDQWDYLGADILDLDGKQLCYRPDGDGYTLRLGGCNTAPVADAGAAIRATTDDVFVDIDADTLNTASNGNWLTGYLETDLQGDVAVLLDGSGSTDEDGDALEYIWTLYGDDGSVYDAYGVSPTVTLPAGHYEVYLEVNDGELLSEDVTTLDIALLDLATVSASDLAANGVTATRTGFDPATGTLMAKFDRSAVTDTLSVGDDQAVRITLAGVDVGGDTVRVISRGRNSR